MKNESQQNHSRWWNWSRDTAQGILACFASATSESLGKTRHESRIPLSSIKEQGDLLKKLTHQATQNEMLTRLGPLESGNLMKWWKIEQGDQLYSSSTRTDSLLRAIIWTLTPKQNQNVVKHPDHSCAGWTIEGERCWTNPQKMQYNTATNILLNGKCFLRHQKYREQTHNETDVRDIWTVNIGTTRRDFWSVSNQLGKFSIETVLLSIM